MKFDLVNNLQICSEIIETYIPVSVVYYSHVPTAIISLLLGFFIFFKNKELVAKIIFLITIVFSIWAFIDIILWTSLDSQNYVFFWSLTVILETLLFILSIYLINVFALGRDISFKNKLFWALIFFPIILLTSTKYNIGYFNIPECVPVDNILYPIYALFLRGILSLWLFINFVYLFKKINKQKRVELSLMFSGLFIFLTSFFASNYLGTYFINKNILTFVDGYKIEMYSLFLFPLFLGLLTFIIVRFKAFNIKLLGAQALVWAMVILVGAQFLFIKSTINMVLNSVTFVAMSISGFILVRSVKKVDTQRELLEVANQNQQSLLHFITHQVKGYLAKSRNIFDGMIAGDYDKLPSRAEEMAKAGFDSDTKGVETVLAILRASDLKTGKTAFMKTKTNISALVAEIISSTKDVSEKKKLELSFEIEPNIEIQVDPVQIKEVFKNLITNSVLYTPQGTVHVVLKRESKNIRFAVIDTGVGLSDVDKQKLFTEGGKGENSLSVNVDSTGYGLYIAKQIIDQHKGTIGARSEGKGKGSEFFVLLPDLQ